MTCIFVVIVFRPRYHGVDVPISFVLMQTILLLY